MLRRLLLCLFVLGAFVLPPPTLQARERVQGWCEQGGNTLTVVGLETTDTTQQSFPGCTVTVWDAGTTDIATIFSDDVGTIKANPFTADATTGLWSFYADNARYDVQLSGAGIAAPFTLADFLLADTAQAVTSIAVVASSATPVFDVGKASILTNVLTADVTSSTITNGVTGQVITIHIAQDGTGGWTFVWPTDAVLRTGTLVVSDDASAVTVATFYYTGTEWREIGVDSDEIGRDILPVTAGRNIGSAAARWDFFGQTLDVSTTSVLTGNITFGASILPSATGQDIGSVGARPDGVFDVFTSGVLNTERRVDGNKFTTVQAAVDDAPAGGVVDARGVTETITGTLALNKSITLLIDGATITVSGASAEILVSASDVEILGGGTGVITHSGNTGGGDVRVLKIGDDTTSIENIRVLGVRFVGVRAASVRNGLIGIMGKTRGVWIQRNKFKDCPSSCVILSGQANDDIFITHNQADEFYEAFVDIVGYNSTRISVEYNKLKTTAGNPDLGATEPKGMTLEPNTNGELRDISFSHNKLTMEGMVAGDLNNTEAFALSESGGSPPTNFLFRRIRVEHNDVRSIGFCVTSDWLRIGTVVGPASIRVSDNHFEAVRDECIQIAGAADTTHHDEVIVADNTILGPGERTTNTFDAIILGTASYPNVRKAIVSDNVISRRTDETGSTNYRYGVNLSQAGVTRSVVAGNTIEGAGTAPVNDAGALNQIYGNNDGADTFSWYAGTGFRGILDHTNSADRTYTFPNVTTTMAGLAVAQTFTADQTFTGDHIVGTSGTAFTRHLSGTASLDYDLSAGGITCQRLDITVTNASVGDVVDLGLPSTLQLSGVVWDQWVPSSGTVRVQACDVESSNPNPAAATVRVGVWQH